jgi:hypothetical protein
LPLLFRQFFIGMWRLVEHQRLPIFPHGLIPFASSREHLGELKPPNRMMGIAPKGSPPGSDLLFCC